MTFTPTISAIMRFMCQMLLIAALIAAVVCHAGDVVVDHSSSPVAGAFATLADALASIADDRLINVEVGHGTFVWPAQLELRENGVVDITGNGANLSIILVGGAPIGGVDFSAQDVTLRAGRFGDIPAAGGLLGVRHEAFISLTRCIVQGFVADRVGGLVVVRDESSVSFEDTIFEECGAPYGGIIGAYDSSIAMTGVTIQATSHTAVSGGVVYGEDVAVDFEGCVFETVALFGDVVSLFGASSGNFVDDEVLLGQNAIHFEDGVTDVSFCEAMAAEVAFDTTVAHCTILTLLDECDVPALGVLTGGDDCEFVCVSGLFSRGH